MSTSRIAKSGMLILFILLVLGTGFPVQAQNVGIFVSQLIKDYKSLKDVSPIMKRAADEVEDHLKDTAGEITKDIIVKAAESGGAKTLGDWIEKLDQSGKEALEMVKGIETGPTKNADNNKGTGSKAEYCRSSQAELLRSERIAADTYNDLDRLDKAATKYLGVYSKSLAPMAAIWEDFYLHTFTQSWALAYDAAMLGNTDIATIRANWVSKANWHKGGLGGSTSASEGVDWVMADVHYQDVLRKGRTKWENVKIESQKKMEELKEASTKRKFFYDLLTKTCGDSTENGAPEDEVINNSEDDCRGETCVPLEDGPPDL